MSDQPTPPPGPEAEDNQDAGKDDSKNKKPRRPRSDIRQVYLDELTLSTEIATAAEKPAYAAALEEAGTDAAAIAAFKAKLEAARGLATSTGGKKTEKKGATLDEERKKSALVILIGKVQSRAKAKYGRGNPRRKDYHIGKAIDNSRALLEQAALDVHTHATTDTKLNIAPALLTSLKAARDAYMGGQGEQTGKTTEATSASESLAATIKELAIARRDIQFAADAAWPAREKIHGAIRREFKIPANRSPS